MATIERFEDLKPWQKARELCCSINTITNKGDFARDWSLKDQIKRSSGSSMDNIAEGFDGNSSKEFRQYFFVSKASTSEVKSQLYRALDQNYITKTEFDEAFSLATDVSKLIGGLLNYLKDKNTRQIA